MSMSKLSLKVLLGVFALMFSTNSSYSFPIECKNVDPTPLFRTFVSASAAKSWLPNKIILRKSTIDYFGSKKNRSSTPNNWTFFFSKRQIKAKYLPSEKRLKVQFTSGGAYKMHSPVYYRECVNKAQSAKKTTSGNIASNVSKPNIIKSKFMKFSSTDRRKIQSTLYDLGFYRSSIDGLYGRGTETALKDYNTEYLGAADLGKSYNVTALFKDILAPQVFETEEVVANKSSKTFIGWSDDTICKYVNEKGKDIHVAEAKSRGLDCSIMNMEKVEPELTPKLDIAEVQASYAEKDYSKAFKQAQILAVQGNPEAQFLLGKMFADGRGTIQVTTIAHMWFNIASMGGIDKAYEERKTITSQMTPSAVEEAQKMAMNCIQSNYADCGLTVKPTALTKPKSSEKIYISSGSQVEAWFKGETALKRKQLHYALKKLGIYNSSVDGLWGGNTSEAFTQFIKEYKRDAETVEEVFVSILSKVKVPSVFSDPKRVTANKSTKRSSNAGLTPIVSNPSMSGSQALAVCEPQAKLAGRRAADSYQSPSYGSSTRCTSFTGYSINCNTSSNSGGFWGGVAEGLGAAMDGKRARDAVLESCLAQYGWKK